LAQYLQWFAKVFALFGKMLSWFCKPSVVGSNPTTGSSSCCLRTRELHASEGPLSVKLSVNRAGAFHLPQKLLRTLLKLVFLRANTHIVSGGRRRVHADMGGESARNPARTGDRR
jgi:hypothetical protein